MPPPTCRNGHPYPEHLAHNNRGWAYCRACARAANRAHYHRNRPPAITDRRKAVVDAAAIERAVSGDPPPRLTPSERAEVVAVLTRRGCSARQIAEHARCTSRTVDRIRAWIAQGNTATAA
ncbi:hypothetical protein [Streptomyces erythrochromogenes]|uniref:hypothetical protein n=1 Tax=Streptomyces erythrochromogenes TaxID=285574 RepID=UPI00224DA957|nr:hypothetical protein [Streptomyces erythrochromogenes]MCX5587590.1 hypothetical protein [Streptomyces erythrochromogenes]